MILNSIDMVNWKCFDHKKVDFERLNIINWKNGEGKTSLIEAIILCLFDKRPNNLNFESLVDISKPTKIVLKFTHNASTYIVEREVGKTSSYKLYKDEELISRTRNESKEILSKIISESVLTSLWGCEPLYKSSVLNSSYLYDILEGEFEESLAVRQYFVSDKSYNQKHKSTLEGQIKNQEVTQEDVDNLTEEVNDLDNQIRSKTFVADSDFIRAKKAKEDYEIYQELQAQIEGITPPYDRETCLRLRKYGKSEAEWEAYFAKVEEDLENEKKKTSASPLSKYPKSTIDALIKESKADCKCALCGKSDFVEPKIDYDTIDNAKILNLESILADKSAYVFADFALSVKYWSVIKKMSPVEYSKDVDFESVLSTYNAETNQLYADFDKKKAELDSMNKDFAKIAELLNARSAYDKDKECIDITDAYIAQAKEFYAEKIVTGATELLSEINNRYVKLFIKDGVYMVDLYDKDYTVKKTLPVATLSQGERGIVAFSLIMTIRDMFMPHLPLIMDESFANLDSNNLLAIKEIMQKDKNQWIVVSHDERLL